MEKRTIVRVALIAVPEGVVSSLVGIYDVLANVDAVCGQANAGLPLFELSIVSSQSGALTMSGGLPMVAQGVDDAEDVDILIMPSVLVPDTGWVSGRHAKLVEWANRQYAQGSKLCSVCTGLFLLAETGCFDKVTASMHWSFAELFEQAYPNIVINPAKALTVSGEKQELLSTGAHASWHDLALYIIDRHIGTAAMQTTAKFFALEWHRDQLGHCNSFTPPLNHGDAAVIQAQEWLGENYTVTNPVAQLAEYSSLAERSLKRRFVDVTGYSVIQYVQQLRIEQAKRLLEQDSVSVEEVSWNIGYDDEGYFRRLFKRLTGVSPSAYRRHYCVPDHSP